MDRRLRALDGLRACGAFAVVAYHVAVGCSLSRSGTLAPLLAQLKAGVAVFFVLSGFLLYLPYARALGAGDPLPDWRTYLHRRALRILPGYWVTLTLLAPGLLHVWLAGPDLWRYYGLAQIYDPNTVLSGLGVAWSLCVEVSFYACLPVFAMAVRRLNGSRQMHLGMLAALALTTAALRLVLADSFTAGVPHASVVLATALPGFLDWFAAGMAVAVLVTAWTAGDPVLPWLRALAARRWACWTLAAAGFVAVAFSNRQDLFLPLYGLAAHVGIGLAATLVLLPAVGSPAGVGVLASRPLAWLGTVSYGVYLWNVAVIETLRGPLPPLDSTPARPLTAVAVLLATLAGATALGAASWYLVERPARRLFAPGRNVALEAAR